MRYFLLLCAVLFVSGCAGLEIPNPGMVVKKPLGTESVKIGMHKDNVREIWGEPDDISFEKIGSNGREREVWTYMGKYTGVPVDAGYLSRTKKLYFDGNSLTKLLE